MIQLIIYGLAAGLLSLIGGFAVLWQAKQVKKIILPLLAFAAGTFLGVAFLELLPEAAESAREVQYVFMAALGGFFLFFALERVLIIFAHHKQWTSDHTHSEHSESLPVLVVLSDSFHNLLDGVVIGLAYLANPALALPTALAIAAHEIPQEIGDFAILLDSGWKRSKIIAVNIISSLLSLVGIAAAVIAGAFLEPVLPYLLGAVGGVFIYIAAADLIPEIQDRAKHKNIYWILPAFLLGVVVVGYLLNVIGHSH